MIEDRSRIYDHVIPTDLEDNYPLAPGNMDYSNDFLEAWHKLVGKEEVNDLCVSLLNFLEKVTRRITEVQEESIRRAAPTMLIEKRKKEDFCCSQCGINHEGRDFIRATLLHLLDHLERNDKFLDFMKKNEFLDQDIYHQMISPKEGRFKEDKWGF